MYSLQADFFRRYIVINQQRIINFLFLVVVYANEYDSEFVGRYEYYKMYSAEQAEKRMTKQKYELYQEYGDFIDEEERLEAR